jgi:hypothetical protein
MVAAAVAAAARSLRPPAPRDLHGEQRCERWKT